MYLQFLGHRALRESCLALQESRSVRWESRSVQRDSLLARGGLLTFERHCKRLHLEFVYVSIDGVSAIIFYNFVANSVRKFFFWPVNTDKWNFVSFLVFVVAAALFTTKISSFKTVAKWDAIFNPVPKQWISMNIASDRSQSECAKIAIHWFGEY